MKPHRWKTHVQERTETHRMQNRHQKLNFSLEIESIMSCAENPIEFAEGIEGGKGELYNLLMMTLQYKYN